MAWKRVDTKDDSIELYEEVADGWNGGFGGYTPIGGASLYDSYLKTNPAKAKPTYTDSYGGKMAELYEKISGRGPFQYDAAKDPLFQNYRDRYVQQGKLAMKDTMGQAAALTGGYANTYGQQVGQQAYDAYLQKLGDVIPTLYGMAYQQYQDAGDQMLKQYSMLGDMRDQEYGRYRDELGDWQNERTWLSQLEAEDYKRRAYDEKTAYERQQDEYQRQWNESERSYSRQQDAYANLYAAIKASGYRPSDEELAAAGMSREAADAIAAEYQRNVDMDERNMALRENSTYSSGGGGGGSSGGGGGGRSYGGGGGGSSGGSSGGYSGDIWDDTWAQYGKVGYQNTVNDLNKLYKNGAITSGQYTTGQLAAGRRWTEDHALSVINSALNKTTSNAASMLKKGNSKAKR